MEFMPIMEFSTPEPELIGTNSHSQTEDRFDADAQTDTGYSKIKGDGKPQTFAPVPPELLIDTPPLPPLPPPSFQHQAAEEDFTTETREITLEEFSAMLHQDPGLVAELSAQFGIETTDPQAIVDAVIAQMQQQVQPITGDLSTATAPSSPISGFSGLEADVQDGDLRSISTQLEPNLPPPLIPHHQQPPLPPPPPRRLECKPEDPRTHPPITSEEAPQQPATRE
jgi:hypothetical protein